MNVMLISCKSSHVSSKEVCIKCAIYKRILTEIVNVRRKKMKCIILLAAVMVLCIASQQVTMVHGYCAPCVDCGTEGCVTHPEFTECCQCVSALCPQNPTDCEDWCFVW